MSSPKGHARRASFSTARSLLSSQRAPCASAKSMNIWSSGSLQRKRGEADGELASANSVQHRSHCVQRAAMSGSQTRATPRPRTWASSPRMAALAHHRTAPVASASRSMSHPGSRNTSQSRTTFVSSTTTGEAPGGIDVMVGWFTGGPMAQRRRPMGDAPRGAVAVIESSAYNGRLFGRHCCARCRVPQRIMRIPHRVRLSRGCLQCGLETSGRRETHGFVPETK